MSNLTLILPCRLLVRCGWSLACKLDGDLVMLNASRGKLRFLLISVNAVVVCMATDIRCRNKWYAMLSWVQALKTLTRRGISLAAFWWRIPTNVFSGLGVCSVGERKLKSDSYATWNYICVWLSLIPQLWRETHFLSPLSSLLSSLFSFLSLLSSLLSLLFSSLLSHVSSCSLLSFPLLSSPFLLSRLSSSLPFSSAHGEFWFLGN